MGKIPYCRVHYFKDGVKRAICSYETPFSSNTRSTFTDLIEAMGGRVMHDKNQVPEDFIAPGGSMIHEVGGAIMGADAKKSVCNSWNQTWDVKNLFICDGSPFASNAESIDWIEAEATKRFGESFANLDVAQQSVLCDEICNAATAKPEFKKAAAFFLKFRGLCAAGYYSTQERWKAIGFVGNLPSASFEGPPPEVLRKLGVERTVK